MVKLSADVIIYADTYTNAAKDRELDLKGQRIPVIENLGATRNQFDCINLCENDIKVVGNFPLLPRLSMLLLANNRVSKIDAHLADSIGSLHTLVLTNNAISELGDLDPLSELSQLQHLSLLGNPVTRRKHYREYVIWRIKSLRVLDFQRIRDKERQVAKQLFITQGGKMTDLAKAISSTKSAPTGTAVGEAGVAKSTAMAGLSVEETQRVKDAIKNATSLAGIQRLEEQLSKGRVPEVASANDVHFATDDGNKDEDGNDEMQTS